MLLVVAATFADAVAGHDVERCLLARSLEPPSTRHLLGTDLQGCDLLARLLHGARSSLVIAAAVTLGAGAIGLLVGAWAAWAGGWVDAVVSRVTDTMFAIPVILTALLVFGITGERSLGQVVLVLTAFSWPPLARVARAAVVERLTHEYVDAARALGAGPWRILRREVLPGVVGQLAPFALPYAGSVVTLEAVLSFVGAGLQLPNVSWGLMLAGLGGQLGIGPRVARAPHLVAPAVALTILVWSLVDLGAWLRRRHPSDAG